MEEEYSIPDYIVPNVELLAEIGKAIGYQSVATMTDEELTQAFRLVGVITPQAFYLLEQQRYAENQEITPRGLRMLRIISESRGQP